MIILILIGAIVISSLIVYVYLCYCIHSNGRFATKFRLKKIYDQQESSYIYYPQYKALCKWWTFYDEYSHSQGDRYFSTQLKAEEFIEHFKEITCKKKNIEYIYQNNRNIKNIRKQLNDLERLNKK